MWSMIKRPRVSTLIALAVIARGPGLVAMGLASRALAVAGQHERRRDQQRHTAQSLVDPFGAHRHRPHHTAPSTWRKEHSPMAPTRDQADRLHSRYGDASARLSSDSVSGPLGRCLRTPGTYYARPCGVAHQDHEAALRVREIPPRRRLASTNPPTVIPAAVRLRPDLQAAMEVIGSRTATDIRLEADAGYMPDLRGADLVRLELRDGNLSGIDMRGSVLWGADLMCANLSGSELQYVDFSSPWVVRGQERPTDRQYPRRLRRKAECTRAQHDATSRCGFLWLTNAARKVRWRRSAGSRDGRREPAEHDVRQRDAVWRRFLQFAVIGRPTCPTPP